MRARLIRGSELPRGRLEAALALPRAAVPAVVRPNNATKGFLGKNGLTPGPDLQAAKLPTKAIAIVHPTFGPGVDVVVRSTRAESLGVVGDTVPGKPQGATGAVDHRHGPVGSAEVERTPRRGEYGRSSRNEDRPASTHAQIIARLPRERREADR